ncbi:MAG: LytTR family DNA-binding domain-containing protein [Terriglobales bacterium]
MQYRILEDGSDSLVGGGQQHSLGALGISRDMGEKAARLTETFPGLPALAKLQSLRVAIKSRGGILFIHLGDVVSVQAQGNYVLLQLGSSSHLLRDSISVVEEKLGPYGLIRIHRSLLVNAAFVEGIRPYPTGEYGLQIKGGKEYTVTRTYKKNLKFLAKFWIGTGGFFSS